MILIRIPRLPVEGKAMWPIIFIKEFKEEIIYHEWIHLEQQKELLLVGAYLFYWVDFLVQLAKHRKVHAAYMNTAFEREAYANMRNYGYLSSRKRYAFFKYIDWRFKKK